VANEYYEEQEREMVVDDEADGFEGNLEKGAIKLRSRFYY
jgi:hypothetical protein